MMNVCNSPKIPGGLKIKDHRSCRLNFSGAERKSEKIQSYTEFELLTSVIDTGAVLYQ